MSFVSSLFFYLTAVLLFVDDAYTQAPQTRCDANTPCPSNAQCVMNTCQCAGGFVLVPDGRCVAKLQPGETPCSFDIQCTSVWPGTRCVNTMCQCSKGTHIRTRDGIMCVEHGQCPLGGRETVLRDQSGLPTTCTVSKEGTTQGCLGQLGTYDCLQNKLNGTYYCCPNKANACSRPVDPGTLGAAGSTQRWYFDSVMSTCRNFLYMGAGGNANNFASETHCLSYCNETCPRGDPQFRTGEGGLMHQFVQSEQTCTASSGCSDGRYGCQLTAPRKSLCCPRKNFICSGDGGLSTRSGNTGLPYDEGVSCGSGGGGSAQRFYFDSNQQRCQPFPYKGCGGNFNNFGSIADCEAFCLGKVGQALIDPLLRRDSALPSSGMMPTGSAFVRQQPARIVGSQYASNNPWGVTSTGTFPSSWGSSGTFPQASSSSWGSSGTFPRTSTGSFPGQSSSWGSSGSWGSGSGSSFGSSSPWTNIGQAQPAGSSFGSSTPWTSIGQAQPMTSYGSPSVRPYNPSASWGGNTGSGGSWGGNTGYGTSIPIGSPTYPTANNPTYPTGNTYPTANNPTYPTGNTYPTANNPTYPTGNTYPTANNPTYPTGNTYPTGASTYNTARQPGYSTVGQTGSFPTSWNNPTSWSSVGSYGNPSMGGSVYSPTGGLYGTQRPLAQPFYGAVQRDVPWYVTKKQSQVNPLSG